MITSKTLQLQIPHIPVKIVFLPSSVVPWLQSVSPGGSKKKSVKGELRWATVKKPGDPYEIHESSCLVNDGMIIAYNGLLKKIPT